MTNHLSTHKSFVKSDEAMIVCPECSTTRGIGAARFRHRQHILKIKCKCGHLFKVQLEFRRHVRKPTELEGIYDLKSPGSRGGKIKITNLSLCGACFEVLGIHDIKVNQAGTIDFTLDNRQKSEIFKKVVIKSVNGNRIGCEFVSDRAYEKALGFYLLS